MIRYLVPLVYAVTSLILYLLGIQNGKQASLVTILLSLGYYNGFFTCKILGGNL